MVCADLLQLKSSASSKSADRPSSGSEGGMKLGISSVWPTVFSGKTVELLTVLGLIFTIKCEGESFYYKYKYILKRPSVIQCNAFVVLFCFFAEKNKRNLNFTKDIYLQVMVSRFSSFNVFFHFSGQFCKFFAVASLWLQKTILKNTVKHFFSKTDLNHFLEWLFLFWRFGFSEPTSYNSFKLPLCQMRTTDWVTSPRCVKAAKENRAFLRGTDLTLRMSLYDR